MSPVPTFFGCHSQRRQIASGRRGAGAGACLAPLELSDGALEVNRDSASLGVGHQPARTQQATQACHLRTVLWHRDVNPTRSCAARSNYREACNFALQLCLATRRRKRIAVASRKKA